MLVEKQTYHGRWWFPGAPEKKTYGILEIESSGLCNLTIMLDKEHDLRDFFPKDWNKNEDLKCPRMIGLLYEIGKIAVAERITCVYGLKSGFDTIKCYPTIVCISVIDFENDELLFDNIRLEIPGTGDFVPDSGFNFSFDDSAESSRRFNVSHEPTPAIEIFSHDDYKLEAITWYSHDRSNKADGTSISITETKKFKLSSSKLLTIDNLLRDSISLNYFICLLFGRAIPIKSIQSIYSLDGEFFDVNVFAHIEPDPSEISPYSTASPLIQFNKDTNDNMGEMIHEFINLRKERHAIYEAFFSSRFGNDKYITTRFFMIVTAIDGFHRQLRDPAKRPFKDRINEVFAEFDEVLGIEFDWGQRSDRIVAYRDQHAHIFDPNPDRDNLEMHELTNMLHVVFVVLFLSEAGKKCGYRLPANSIMNGWASQYLPPRKQGG